MAFVSEKLYNYWITKEILLFQTRLNHILDRELHKFKSILYQLEEFTDKKKFINKTLNNICIFFFKTI